MIETIDNSLQFAATLVCCAVSSALHFKRRSAEHFLLAAFYGCFAMGLLYWTLYLVLFEATPGTFCVSEIVWISSCIFLCLLQYTLASPAERASRRPAMYVAPASGVVLFAVFFFADGGSLFADIMRCCVMSAGVGSCARPRLRGAQALPHRHALLRLRRIRPLALVHNLAGRHAGEPLLLD